MKIILRADVENLGRLGDVVEVKNGYARNYLIPQGFAMLATKASLKTFELERKKLQAQMDALRSAASDLSNKIQAEELVIRMRVGDNNKLYGAVTTHIIADQLAEKGVEVDRRRILLDAPIRLLGDYEVRVRLHADVVAVLKVKVAAEERTVYEDEAVAVVEEAKELVTAE
ncbi:50S ribosomal protein L9 [Desulfovibrio litoralis]|uniref:Large ribosomal subunit protein bL9 n=1 Tax=Desulfovibrio litoralis DSM 11393 TaxID=1121455 RepID=A0A1M7SAY0_9BACT|nr:50S ribosomal protein L9 [Desulfovibrio litoralis]SHN55598.1 LSU ribosomal protein L9P [Desulfovibrio litoralis DSM 11393]